MGLRHAQLGALSALVAILFFSVNDMTIKFLSGSYALHQVVFIRSIIGLAITLAVFAPFNGGWGVFRTTRLGEHLIRGGFVFFANMFLFLGLAAMPIAEATAIFFVSPLIITLFSVIFLGETVGPWRWVAIAVGFVGVVIMIRPGGDTFQLASLFPLGSAVFYAALNTLTRRMGQTESAATMSVYIQVMFIVMAVAVWLLVGDGRYGDTSDPSLQFLLRAWEMPPLGDSVFFLIIGAGVAFAGFFISYAYKVAPAAVVAPFEYAAIPLALFWGIVVFDDWPDAIAYVGMGLIVLAGIITVWREAVNTRKERRRALRS